MRWRSTVAAVACIRPTDKTSSSLCVCRDETIPKLVVATDEKMRRGLTRIVCVELLREREGEQDANQDTA